MHFTHLNALLTALPLASAAVAGYGGPGGYGPVKGYEGKGGDHGHYGGYYGHGGSEYYPEKLDEFRIIYYDAKGVKQYLTEFNLVSTPRIVSVATDTVLKGDSEIFHLDDKDRLSFITSVDDVTRLFAFFDLPFLEDPEVAQAVGFASLETLAPFIAADEAGIYTWLVEEVEKSKTKALLPVSPVPEIELLVQICEEEFKGELIQFLAVLREGAEQPEQCVTVELFIEALKDKKKGDW